MRSIATLASFFIVLILYFLYGFVLVPVVLPEQKIQRAGQVQTTENTNREEIEPFLAALPEDGWEHDLKHEIHFLQFGTTIVLFGHDTITGKMIRLEPCTVMIVPDTDEHISEESRKAWLRQAIILRTQQYAEIEFDGDFDMTKLPLPKLVAGRLYGKVAINSGMKDEGEQDDLVLEVENVAITETEQLTKIETLKDVRFQLGYHTGEGTNLSLELIPKTTDSTAAVEDELTKELSSVTFQRLKTLHLVFPENEKTTYKMHGGVPVPDGAATVLDVRCQRQCGFLWNTGEKCWQTSFNGDVNVTRSNPDKTVDKLTAEEMIITLQENTATNSKSQKQSNELSGNFGSMEPVKFVARGKQGVRQPQPARFSLKHGADVQLVGDEIYIDLKKKLLKLSTFDQKTEPAASKEIEMILSGLYSIRSDNTVEYTLAENGAFGSFKSIGKGSLTTLQNAQSLQSSAKRVNLAWNEMAIAPHPVVKDQLVIKLGKGIQAVMDGFGRLSADEIEICCNIAPQETNKAGNNKTQQFAQSSNIAPDHIVVKDKVRFTTDTGTCDVNRLDIYFTNVGPDGKISRSRWTPQALMDKPPQCPKTLPANSNIELVQYLQSNPLQPLPVMPQPAAASQQSGMVASNRRLTPLTSYSTQPVSSQNLFGLQSNSQGKFAMNGNLMKMQVRYQNNQTTAEIVSIEGNVKVNETGQDKDNAFGLTGDSATIWDPGGVNTTLKITSAVNSQGAFIKGRGIELYSKELNVTRADNQCWSPYPGRLVATVAGTALKGVTGGAAGNLLPAKAVSQSSPPSKLLVEWNKNMQFDGKVLRFFGQNDKTGNRVQILYQTQSLWCDTMEIYLNRQVQFFDDTSNITPKAEMLQCAHNVFIRSRETDSAGKQTSISTAEAELLRYYIDKDYLVAEGPGMLSTTFQKMASTGTNKQGNVLSGMTNSNTGNSLQHLSIWFQDTLQGVLVGANKNVILNGRVEAAYFPAAGWDDTIDHENFASARKMGCTLECEKITVTEMPNPANPKEGTFELTAEDDAVIDGYGVFGKAQLIKYSQLKNTVRFEKGVKVKMTSDGQNGNYEAESAEYNIETGSISNVGMKGLNIGK
ncbi:hypothetical protein FACS189419_06710 [Planctomycetales bacterium]|nr:hypothetical protein FACS189419_06710 [Planctomycetales bacterium]